MNSNDKRKLEIKARKYLEQLTGAKLGATLFCYADTVRFVISADQFTAVLHHLQKTFKRRPKIYPFTGKSAMYQWSLDRTGKRTVSIIHNTAPGCVTAVSVNDCTKPIHVDTNWSRK